MSKLGLTLENFTSAAAIIGCEVAAIRAVADVESHGEGFITWRGQLVPKILFERHKFYKYTNGQFAGSHPDLCNKTPGGYGSVSVQHDKLTAAAALDRTAALMSCSWGKFQVMGFNYALAGYRDLQTFINAAYNTEFDHLLMFTNFVLNTGLGKHLRSLDWAAFAKGYNGPDYKKNHYDNKMATAYKKFK